jgi:hypothetical protein
MIYTDLAEYTRVAASKLAPGPVAVLFMEDLSETNSTIRHHLKLGFANVIVLGVDGLVISPELVGKIGRVIYDPLADGAVPAAMNALMPTFGDRWVYYGYNAEYLFYPFCESRSITELTAFVTEERRASVLSYVIDLYAGDLEAQPNGVSLEDAYLDQSGYFAHSRKRDGEPLERQLDMFGGLRWRYEEHVPEHRRKIDRVGLFRARKDLILREDHTFSDEEYNTYACPWHHNPTATVCSFRAAKSLKSNAGSKKKIKNFRWKNSGKFQWHSGQLLDLGLMEPGQWF